MVAPISLSASVKPSRFSYTVSCTIDSPLAWVSATTSGCCQSVMKPGWTSVSSTSELQVAARVPEPDALVVDLEGAADLAEDVEERHQVALPRAARRRCRRAVASAAHAHEAASMRSGIARWV